MKKVISIAIVGILLIVFSVSCKSLRGCDCPKFGENRIQNNGTKA
jgi:hypothetical protein